MFSKVYIHGKGRKRLSLRLYKSRLHLPLTAQYQIHISSFAVIPKVEEPSVLNVIYLRKLKSCIELQPPKRRDNMLPSISILAF
jgi:hypothetical protein